MSGVFPGGLGGGGARRSREGGLVGAEQDLAAGSMLARERAWGSTASPTDSSTLSFMFTSSKAITSPEDESSCVCL